jgi:hypothetical protein
MQKGSLLEFSCQACQTAVKFNIFDLETKELIKCPSCTSIYSFDDEVFLRQIKKFEALCRQIRESEEILSNTSIVGIDVGERQIKIPYKLLLTRLSSSLDLKIGDVPLTITFRIEPTKDVISSCL